LTPNLACRHMKTKVTITLIILGILFRFLFWWVGQSEFDFLILFEGALSGFGVAVGIILATHLQGRMPKKHKWLSTIVPYACGGLAVFLGKLAVKAFLSVVPLSTDGAKK